MRAHFKIHFIEGVVVLSVAVMTMMTTEVWSRQGALLLASFPMGLIFWQHMHAALNLRVSVS